MKNLVQRARKKFKNFSDIELVALRCLDAGAVPGIKGRIFNRHEKSIEKADYRLNTMIQMECQRRGMIPKRYIWAIDSKGECTHPENGIAHPE